MSSHPNPGQGQPSGYQVPQGYSQQGQGQPSAYQGQTQAYGAAGYGQSVDAQPPHGVYQPQMPASPRRPGSGTAAGVMGIIFGVFGFLGYGWRLMMTTGALELAAAEIPLQHSGLALGSAGLGLASAILVFWGAIQLLSGNSNVWILIATGAYLLSLALDVVNILLVGDGGGLASVFVVFGLFVVLAVIMAGLANTADVKNWLRQRARR